LDDRVLRACRADRFRRRGESDRAGPVEGNHQYKDERLGDAAAGQGALPNPEQAGDVGMAFGPMMATVNSDCERTEYEATGRKLKWRLQCKGQIDMDVAGEFNFDSPSHYTATIATKGWMAGALMTDVKTELEGEHVGECQ
jgi:hypothetical protein